MSSQKSYVITGASRGIGFETAKFLAKEGHRLWAIARSAGSLHELAAEYPDQITPVVADLGLPAEVRRLEALLPEKLDGLLHAAGLLVNLPFIEQTDDDWGQQWNVNVMSAVGLSRLIVPRCSENAHIVFISSMGGFQGSVKFPGLSAYSTTKGALSILAEVLAAELSPLQIRVNALCLGAVQTEMLEKAFPGYQAPLSATEAAEFVADFLLNKHWYFNGQILPVARTNP